MTPLSNTTEIIIHNKYNFYIPLYESEIIQFQYEGPVLVMGDMNGRELRENQTIWNQMGKHTLMTHRLIKANNFRPLESNDSIVNRNGQQLLLLCNTLGLIITYGGRKGDSLGRFTYCSPLSSNVVAYAVTDPSHINYSTVRPQNPLSEHSHITLSYK